MLFNLNYRKQNTEILLKPINSILHNNKEKFLFWESFIKVTEIRFSTHTSETLRDVII